MGGKRLKFPRREKYKPPIKKVEIKEEKSISEEEHKKRVELLKNIGLLKEENKKD